MLEDLFVQFPLAMLEVDQIDGVCQDVARLATAERPAGM